MPYVEFDVPRRHREGHRRLLSRSPGDTRRAAEWRGVVRAPRSGRTRSCCSARPTAPQPHYDGHHVQIYVANFSGPYRQLLGRDLISQEDNQYQYRFNDIVDLADGRHLFAIEHEVRSVTHPLYARPLVNRNPARPTRLTPTATTSGTGRWGRTNTTCDETKMLPSQRALFDIPRDVCYLNAAAWSPLPRDTQEAAREAVGRKGQPWSSRRFAGRQHERARNAAARLINADAADVALIPSVAYGVAIAGKVLAIAARLARAGAGQRSFLAGARMARARGGAGLHGRDRPAQPADVDWTSAMLAAIERPGAAPLALASISSLHWSDGGAHRRRRITAALRQHGAAAC